MSQVKFFGLRESLNDKKRDISDAVHAVVMEVLGLPATKRAHRFFPLEEADFFMPEARSSSYLIVEIMMMSGRTKETRKRLVRRLYEALESRAGISAVDLEICIIESPPENWGFRGLHGDEAQLPYKVQR
jgi:phenylpyruvate tautomerase PptA (4-oxalocrotonate tautomerase family)